MRGGDGVGVEFRRSTGTPAAAITLLGLDFVRAAVNHRTPAAG